jgi:hypothetical protein
VFGLLFLVQFVIFLELFLNAQGHLPGLLDQGTARHVSDCFSDVLFIFITVFVEDYRSVLLLVWLGVDHIVELPLVFVGLIVPIDHHSKLLVVFVNPLVAGDLLSVSNDLQRFHVEIVLETKVNVNFTSPHHQLLQLQILQLFVEDQVGTEFRDIKLEIFLGEDSGFALIGDDSHQLSIDLVVFA